MKPKIKKVYWVAGIFLLIIFGIFLFFRMQEDGWVKDSRGVWVQHGNPVSTPEDVLEQQHLISCANYLFDNFKQEKNSQCLGTCDNYAVDLVHVPRTAEDNLPENQCPDYVSGKLTHFIELDKNGEIVRIV